MASTPLLRLPVEMLRNITDYLEIQDQARLSMTNRYLRSTLPAPTHFEFLRAEASEWAVSKQLYTCKGCVRFRSLQKFADDMRKGTRARSAPDARSRFCLECGVENGWYSEGTNIAIYGKLAVLGRVCSDLTDRCGSKASCGSRALAWTPLQRVKREQYGNNSRHERDDDWAYMARSQVGPRHAEEEYGLWLDI
ncbi:uncharacterized protein CC84DRAFT_935046 [Paraphaeosphaeria sporulosa]|uniref:F-box domain-containing protein n=1 Tax=Paraphaeosphaeria sporulosa TaxID=1460663 RepID=A0A177C530_9PLEO|nr:uncharacterized protein CC84DRAFT_935046 [Paraphaeosphaeria sporulosa]OAG02854.1 hypothetical protein CC84DRAFT_935046 [Paraphaeosphaeria sporulosa]